MILEKERDRMIEDHKRKEEMKKQKDKDKLFSKIREAAITLLPVCISSKIRRSREKFSA